MPTQEEPTTEAIQTLSNGKCLALITNGDTLKDLIQNQFDQVYEPELDYFHYECEGSGETLQCGEAILIPNHNAIQPGWRVEIENLGYDLCLNNGGIWVVNP